MRFRSYGDSQPSLKQAILGRRSSRKHKQTSEFWLYRDLNLTVEHGCRLGVIGANGAGKSTLLKMISGIYHPTRGTIRVTGQIAPLTLGAGMLPALTGAENIVLNGVLLGYSAREMKNKTERILDFAGLREFGEMPIKYYSSGMMARLTFSTATAIDPEILLIDEVFACGDAEFVQKARDKMGQLLDESHIAVLVSHQLELVTKMCTRAIWIDNGRIVSDAEPSEVTRQYLAHTAPAGGQ